MCQKNKRTGTDLSDPHAHHEDHQSWSRRDFLHTLGLGGASMSLSTLPVTALFSSPLAQSLLEEIPERKLVLIRLKGGNDGLNTVIPLSQFDTYRQLRPTIGFQENELLLFNDEFALPQVMQPVKSLWDSGKMRIINSVGYPNHNLSHFTGSDIWASGSSDTNNNTSGWLARYYANQNPEYFENPSTTPPALKIGGPVTRVFTEDNNIDLSANFSSANRLSELAQTGIYFNNTIAPSDDYYGDQILYLRTIANAANRYGKAIFDAYQDSTNVIEYRSGLGEQLSLVARMIKGGLQTQLYLVTLDGFDTHVVQNGNANHPGLLENLSLAISDFYQDLSENDHDHDVLCMTYSEFGRRVMENGFGGTDHGTALPILMFGAGLQGNGIHGKIPDLSDLDDNGNLKFGTDFRAIYATILENWLCVQATIVDEILGAPYDRLSDIGISCMSTSLDNYVNSTFTHKIIPRGNGLYHINFHISVAADADIQLHTISGKLIQTVNKQYYHQGSHQVSIDLSSLQLNLVPLIYTIRLNGKKYAKQFIASSY